MYIIYLKSIKLEDYKMIEISGIEILGFTCMVLSIVIYVVTKEFYEASMNKEDNDDQEIS